MPRARVPATAQELAAAIGAELVGAQDAWITGAAPLDAAGEGELAYLADRRYRSRLKATEASAVVLDPEALADCPCTALVTNSPETAWARALDRLFPARELVPGVHHTAVLGSDARVDPEAQVDAHAVIGAQTRIEERAWIGPGTVVGPGCRIGPDCWIGPNATLHEETEMGARCRIEAGAVLGGRGFGLAPEEGHHREIPQVGRVVLEEDVEIGAGSTVDRGALEETRIGRGTKIDNLVQIGHNCRIGPDCIISGQAGLSGSVELGEGCVLAGQSGVAGHIRIAPGTTVTAKAGVTAEIGEAGIYSGFPHQPHSEWRREVAALRQIRHLRARLEALEQTVATSREGGS